MLQNQNPKLTEQKTQVLNLIKSASGGSANTIDSLLVKAGDVKGIQVFQDMSLFFAKAQPNAALAKEAHTKAFELKDLFLNANLTTDEKIECLIWSSIAFKMSASFGTEHQHTVLGKVYAAETAQTAYLHTITALNGNGKVNAFELKQTQDILQPFFCDILGLKQN